MRLWLLPPHRDVSLCPRPTEAGWEVLDLAADFVRRVSDAAFLAQQVQERTARSGQREAMQELLLLRAAQGLRARAPQDVHLQLRALGATLTAVSGAPSGVRLRLDDLELAEGTTECTADVARAARAPAPYDVELAAARERLHGARQVRLWLEKDQQLPAAVALAAAVPAAATLELAGPFAVQHARALSRVEPLARAVLVREPSCVEWRVEPPPLLAAGTPLPPGLRWRPEGAPLPERGPWAGYVELRRLLEAEALGASGLRCAVLGVCAATRGGRLLSVEGEWLEAAAVERGAQALRAGGVRLVVEWQVGAPGVDEALLGETEEVLAGSTAFDGVLGVRQFHWSLGRHGGWFGGVPVTVHPPPQARDLARSHPFEAAGTPSAEALPQLLQRLALSLRRRAPSSPGRVALASLVPPPSGPPAGEAVVLAAACVVVTLPASLEGEAGERHYAVNLETGSVLAVDARLAPALLRLERPLPPEEAFAALPAASRQKVAGALLGRGVLVRGQA